MNVTKLVLEVDSTSARKAKGDLDSLQGSGEKAQKEMTGLGTAAKAASTALAAIGASIGIREIVQYADEWTNASNRLRLVTSSSQELASVQNELMQVARETRASFSGTAELFTVITRSTKDLGLSQQQVIDITRTLNQSFAVSGTSAAGMDGAIRQLAQGLQSGALRGDEFNSVAEQAPGILDAVAHALQMGRGELREFAATGGITSEVLISAIQGYASAIENDFTKSVATFGQQMGIARDNAMQFVGTSGEINTAISVAGSAIVSLSDNLDTIAEVGLVLAGVMTARIVPGIAASAAASVQAAAAAVTARGAEIARTQALVAATGAEASRTAAMVAGNSSMFTSATALATARTAQLAHTQAVAANTAATATATVGQTAFKSALALVGGPAGALLIAAGSLVYFVSKMESAKESTARLIGELDRLNRQELQRGIDIQKTYIQGLETQIARLEKQNQTVPAVRARMAELRAELEKATVDLQKMNNGMRGVEEREFDKLIDDMTEGFHGFNPIVKESVALTANLERELEKVAKKTQETITGFQQKRAALTMTAREQEIYSAVVALGEHADRDQIARVTEIVGVFYDEKTALEESTKAVEAKKKAQEEMNRAIEQQKIAVTDQIGALISQQHELSMSGKEAYVYEQAMQAIRNGAGPETVETIKTLAAELYEQRTAQEEAKKAAEEHDKAIRQVALTIRDDMSSAFADMMMNGENAFDAIAKSFERMIYKMLADWAAAGIMNLVGQVFDIKDLGGTSTLGTIIGSIGKSAANDAVADGVTAAESGGGILAGAGAAIKGAGSAISGAAAAIPGWGWALAGGAALAAVLGDKSTPSSNAGFLLSDLPGVDANRKQDTPAFASGVDPVLFARREDFGYAQQVADAHREADAAVMQIFNEAGRGFQITGPELAGYDETGAGFGQFFGVAGEDGKSNLTLEQSVTKYMAELIKKGGQYTGIAINPTGTPDQMLEQLRTAMAAADAIAAAEAAAAAPPPPEPVADMTERAYTSNQMDIAALLGTDDLDSIDESMDINELMDAAQLRRRAEQMGITGVSGAGTNALKDAIAKENRRARDVVSPIQDAYRTMLTGGEKTLRDAIASTDRQRVKTGHDLMPYDGYRDILSRTSSGTTSHERQAETASTSALAEAIEGLRTEMAMIVMHTYRTADILQRITPTGDAVQVLEVAA